jgi:rubrerythrin
LVDYNRRHFNRKDPTPMKRSFRSLTDPELIALAVSLEEEEAGLYREFARRVRASNPHMAAEMESLRHEETEHAALLRRAFQERYGEADIPLIRRTDIAGFIPAFTLPAEGQLDNRAIMSHVGVSEAEAGRYYERAAEQTSDPELQQLFRDLAETERHHQSTETRIGAAIRLDESPNLDPEKHLFLLQVIQPGLVGLMDGSVATLAPLFAAAFATRSTHEAFLIGLAASVGAAISMGFAEGLSDDGSLTGRGKPFLRGLVTGGMTFVGGIGHTLPYLIHNFNVANSLAIAVVIVELFAISWIRKKYMDTPFLRSSFQVVFGGLLVFAAGVWIGHG